MKTTPATSDYTQDSKPVVSIIIVTFNSFRYLQACLQSLVAGSTVPQEIIVVDNASTDGSAELISTNFQDVCLIRIDKNTGFSGGNNIGAQKAAGEFLAFINPDTVVESGWLDPLIAGIKDEPAVALTTSRILKFDPPAEINTCGNEMHLTFLTLCRGLGGHRNDYSRAEEVAAVSGAAFVIHKDVFDQLEGFDEDFFLYMEDTDISLRARLAGYTCKYIPDSIIHHDYSLRFGTNKTFYQERNRYLILLKILKWKTLITLFPALIVGEIITWGFVVFIERRNFRNKIRAYFWIISHWGTILNSRRATQRLRQVSDRRLLAMMSHKLAFQQVDRGPIGRVASVLSDAVFLLLKRLLMIVVRW